jgi:hypothetical protein
MLPVARFCWCAALLVCNMALSVWAIVAAVRVNAELRRKRCEEHESKVLLSNTLHAQGGGHVEAC